VKPKRTAKAIIVSYVLANGHNNIQKSPDDTDAITYIFKRPMRSAKYPKTNLPIAFIAQATPTILDDWVLGIPCEVQYSKDV
jgi:hypothetical protein